MGELRQSNPSQCCCGSCHEGQEHRVRRRKLKPDEGESHPCWWRKRRNDVQSEDQAEQKKEGRNPTHHNGLSLAARSQRRPALWRGRESDPFRATLSGGATEESVWERSQWRRAVAVLQVQFRWITACQMRTTTSFNAAKRRWLCRFFHLMFLPD